VSVVLPGWWRRPGTWSVVLAVAIIGAVAADARVITTSARLPDIIVPLNDGLILVPNSGPISRLESDLETTRWRDRPDVTPPPAAAANWGTRAIVATPGGLVVAGAFTVRADLSDEVGAH
jgi:hypothetical protein